jgi:predicted alpha/beta superfamily hydrolase
MKPGIILMALLLSISGLAVAQDGYSEIHATLNSEILKQNRMVSVFLPDGYYARNVKFPVIYVLDADGRDQHIVPTARFLFINNKMPKAIIVGVFNIDRNHDFLPDSSKNAPTGGGADKFVLFFKDELIPYIDKNFKTEPYKVLVGHSYGGLFAMYALLNDPDMFDSYIAIDPSFWYKNQMLVRSAETKFHEAKNWDKTIFITGRQGGDMKDMGITAMEKVLKSSAPKNLNWKIAEYSDEDHGSVPFKSAYDGLRFIFDAGGNFMVYPGTGIMPDGTSAYAIIQNNNPYLRYTTDGSEPDINSPKCKDRIKIISPCTLKVKSVAKKYKINSAVKVVFSKGEFINGLQSVKNLKPGLKYSYYEGVWDSIPDFSKLVPKKTGVTDNLDLQFALKRDSFAVQFEGYLHITKKDMYYIWDLSDDGSKVYFNNQLFLNNDGLHSADNPVVKLVPLNPGYYPLRIDYFEKTGGESISLGDVTFDKKTTPVPFPKEMFFFKE